MKIISLFSKPQRSTGGEIYNAAFFESILELSSFKLDFITKVEYKKGLNFKKLLAPMIELKFFRKTLSYEVCFFSSTMALRQFLLLLLIRLLYPNKKCITIHHHYMYELKTGIEKIFFKFFEVSFLRLSTSIVIPSPYSLKRTKKLMPNKNIHYIELFFDKIANKEIKDTYCKGEFLYVGTIEHRKGLHLMIEALALNSEKKLNFIVNIVGKVTDNAYYSKLLYRIRELNLQDKIIFHGRVSDNKLRFLYNNAELFIFPSLLEGYGMVLIEAMSFGIPIDIASIRTIP